MNFSSTNFSKARLIIIQYKERIKAYRVDVRRKQIVSKNQSQQNLRSYERDGKASTMYTITMKKTNLLESVSRIH